jgi:PKD repeat protein
MTISMMLMTQTKTAYASNDSISHENYQTPPTTTITILEINPVAFFEYSPRYPFVDEIITFNASASTANGSRIGYYDWKFEKWYSRMTEQPITTYYFRSKGVYNVSLTIYCYEGNSTWPRLSTTWKLIRVFEDPTPNSREPSEYLIGKVAVGILLPESNGTIDPSTEDWNSTEEAEVVERIKYALHWWSSQNPDANVSFEYDIHKISVSYEPIDRTFSDQDLWIKEILASLGAKDTVPGVSSDEMDDYLNTIRHELHTDWAFAAFIVDASNDPNGLFLDLEGAATCSATYIVQPYKHRELSSIEEFGRVFAHEFGHIFYATDEYDGIKQYAGYLNVSDIDGSNCIMDGPGEWLLSDGTRGQVGWRDSDGDGIQDIVDTFPETYLDYYSPNPTTDNELVYHGFATEVPYPNDNPNPTYGTSSGGRNWGRNITINKILDVQFRVDDGDWVGANASDGAFDEASEEFVFITPELTPGTHIIEVRAINSVGNIETSYANDTIKIVQYPTASFNVSAKTVLTNEAINFNSSDSYDPDGFIVNCSWDFGDGTNTTGIAVNHYFVDDGEYNVTLTVTDNDYLTDSKYTTVKVFNRRPTAILTKSDKRVYVGDIVYFNASNSYDEDGHIISYSWDFGDKINATGREVNHIFKDEGNFTITLTINDDDDETNTTSTSITVNHLHDVGIVSVATSTYQVCKNQTFSVYVVIKNNGTASEIFNVTTFYGTNVIDTQHNIALGSGSNITLTFVWNTINLTVGNYIISANVSTIPEETNIDDNVFIDGSIKVIDYPTAYFVYSPKNPIVNDIIIFNATDSTASGGTINNYSWDFGDGYYGNDVICYHNYTSFGTYNVTLKVTDNEGLNNTFSTIITVLENKVIPEFSTWMMLPIVMLTSLFVFWRKRKRT